MRRRLTLLLMLPVGLCAQYSHAEALWYGDLDYGVMDVSVNDQSYYPRLLSASAGQWLVNGIGLEVNLGFGTRSDSNKGVDINVSTFQSAYLRWQSPPRGGISAYLLTGFSRLQLDGSVNAAAGYPGKEWFNGPVVGIGLHGKLLSSSHWGATFAYKHYFLEDKLTTDSINLGLRYDF